jgi:hypothetical protein
VREEGRGDGKMSKTIEKRTFTLSMRFPASKNELCCDFYANSDQIFNDSFRFRTKVTLNWLNLSFNGEKGNPLKN